MIGTQDSSHAQASPQYRACEQSQLIPALGTQIAALMTRVAVALCAQDAARSWRASSSRYTQHNSHTKALVTFTMIGRWHCKTINETLES